MSLKNKNSSDEREEPILAPGEILLGKGGSGFVVSRDGEAVKGFYKLSHLVQEYTALRYLKGCKHVVQVKRFVNNEMYMVLYDGSLRRWLGRIDDPFVSRNEDTMIIIHSILMGLIELHDRNLVHGDIRPCNILVSENPLHVVIGDCGFLSIAKYAKLERKAANSEPVMKHDSHHDMYSLGIILFEIVGNLRMRKKANTHEELQHSINKNIKDRQYLELISALTQENRTHRPSARDVLKILFSERPKRWVSPAIYSVSSSDSTSPQNMCTTGRYNMRKMMKITAYEHQINRCKKGYGALLCYIDNNRIKPSAYNAYAAVTLFILASCFGKHDMFTEVEAMKLGGFDEGRLYDILSELLHSKEFVNFLLSPVTN